MRVQDVSCTHALIGSLGQDHDYESASANILDVVAQVCVLLHGSSDAKQRALELRQESVFLTGRIETMGPRVSAQNVDVLSIEASVQPRIDGGVGVRRVSDRPDDTIRDTE